MVCDGAWDAAAHVATLNLTVPPGSTATVVHDARLAGAQLARVSERSAGVVLFPLLIFCNLYTETRRRPGELPNTLARCPNFWTA